MKYQFVTDGERLAYFIERRLLGGVPWRKLSDALIMTGRADHLIEFFSEIAVVNLTCRVVVSHGDHRNT
jgi:hypothetical protein